MNKISENINNNQIINEIDRNLFEGFSTQGSLIDPDIEALYTQSIHDISKVYPSPKPLIFCGKKIWGTAGNFSIITGKAKTKKTFLLSAITSALLTNSLVLHQIRGALNSTNNRILYFDTEQASSHVQIVIERILKIRDLDKKSASKILKVYNLRRYDAKTRATIIEHAIATEKGIGVVIIDGIRDLVYDINNMTEASILASNLLRWTEEKNIHIIGVLHQNKTNSDVRGHLGTEVMNKCETLAEVTSTKNISKVNFLYTRNIEPQSFAFTINNEGLPTECTMPKEKIGSDNIVSNINLDSIKKIIDLAFNGNNTCTTSILIDQIKKTMAVGENKAKDYLKGWVLEEKLLEVSKGKNNSNIYNKNY